MRSIFFVLGNQLFDIKYLKNYKNCDFFMSEDYSLCTYEKHHKLKILHTLSSMRSYYDLLKNKHFKIHYYSHENKFTESYENKLKILIKEIKAKKVYSFEIEDKPFELKMKKLFSKLKIKWEVVPSPMFLNSRNDFRLYLDTVKKPLMSSYYKQNRIKFNLLVKDENPIGGKWSFDRDNRKKLPPSITVPKRIKFKETIHTKNLKIFVNNQFKNHPGDIDNLWTPTTHSDAKKLLKSFIKDKLNLFGDYEDAVSQRDNFLFHSSLSPLINNGLITPKQIIEEIKRTKKDIKINSLEGYIRQIIGWREFIRGIYQNYSEAMESSNFFNHNNKLTQDWYKGTTGIPPLDHSIKNALKYGWTHHIERLMIVSSLMNLCEVKPKIVNKWFMEMFIDSSEWVMTPNVYGMGLFSDGGIFATKPYICGSSYYLKMMDFKKGEWCEIVDGLYWRFIEKNKKFFLTNPRLSMMVRVLEKMSLERKKRIISKANQFIKRYTL